MGKPENSFGHNVTLHLSGAPANRQGTGEHVTVVPAVMIKRSEADASATSASERHRPATRLFRRLMQHSGGTENVTRQLHHVLTVFVGEDLANARFGAGLLTFDPRGEGSHPYEVEQNVFDVDAGEPLAHHRIIDSTVLANRVEHLESRGATPPQHAAARERHSFVTESDLGESPSVSFVAHQIRSRNTNVGEENFVEGLGAGHLGDRPNLDTGQIHRTDEVRNASVLRCIGVGSRDEDPEFRVLRAARPDLLTVHDVFVSVAHRACAEVGEIAATARLAEQLTPELFTGE